MHIQIAVAVALVALACKGDPAPAPAPPPPPPAPIVPACTRVLANHPLAHSHGITAIAWTDPSHLAVLFEATGIATYQVGADSGPVRSFELAAVELAMRTPRTAIVISTNTVATLDLETGCLRTSEPLELTTNDRTQPIVAIDAVHGRVFALTAVGFLRVDLDLMKIAVDAPAPREVRAIAYDATTDRVIVRGLAGKQIRVFDGSTLAEVAKFDLAMPPNGGPWVRPGRAEAVFTYDILCEHYAPAPPGPPRMRGPPCLDKPASLGQRVVRVAIPDGRVLATDAYAGGNVHLGDPIGTWSADGKHLVIGDIFDAVVYDDDAPRLLHLGVGNEDAKAAAWPADHDGLNGGFALDATAERYASELGPYHLRVAKLANGEMMWTTPTP